VTPVLLVIGTIVIAEMLWMVSVTIDSLNKRRHQRPIRSYAEYAEAALGKPGLYVSNITSTCALLGFICNGQVLIAQSANVIMPLSRDPQTSEGWWNLLVTCETLFFAFVNIGALLGKTAVLGPICTIAVLFLIFLGTWRAMGELESSFPEECRDSADKPYQSMAPQGSSLSAQVSTSAQMLAYYFFTFAIIVTVPTLKSQMAKPQKLVLATTSAFAVVCALFFALMMMYYIAFGNLGPDNVITGLRDNRPVGWWAQTSPWQTGTPTWIGNAAAIIITTQFGVADAIYVPCAVIAVEVWAAKLINHTWLAWALPRIGVSLLRLLVSTFVTSFISLSSLTASLFCICNDILIPVLCFYRTGRAKDIHPLRKIFHVAIFLFGLAVVILGTWSAIQAMISANQEPAAGTFPRPGISAACVNAYLAVNGKAR